MHFCPWVSITFTSRFRVAGVGPSWGWQYTSNTARTRATPCGRLRHCSRLVEIPQNVEQHLAEAGGAIPGPALESGQINGRFQSPQVIPRVAHFSFSHSEGNSTSTPSTHSPAQVDRGASVWLAHSCCPAYWPFLGGRQSPHPETASPATRCIGPRNCLGLPEPCTDVPLLAGRVVHYPTWGCLANCENAEFPRSVKEFPIGLLGAMKCGFTTELFPEHPTL